METKELSPKSDKYSVKQHDTLQLINTSNWVLGNIPLWEAAGEEETKKFRQEIKVWVKSGANMFWKEITKIWCAFWMCFPGKEQGTAQTTGGGYTWVVLTTHKTGHRGISRLTAVLLMVRWHTIEEHSSFTSKNTSCFKSARHIWGSRMTTIDLFGLSMPRWLE